MAYISITLEDDIDISANEWWDSATDLDRKEMINLVSFEKTKEPISLMEEDFQAKLKQLSDEYHTLPQSVIDAIMAL